MIAHLTFRQLLFSAVILLSPGLVQGQALLPAQPSPAQVQVVLTAAVLSYRGVAIQQERGLASRITVMGGFGAHYSSFNSDHTSLYGTRFINIRDNDFSRPYTTNGITPYVFAEARIYTNLASRAKHGRDTRANAGTYFAAAGEMPFAPGDLINVDNLQLAYPVGLKVGLRRALGTYVYLDGSMGAMLKISKNERVLGPRLDLALGFH